VTLYKAKTVLISADKAALEYLELVLPVMTSLLGYLFGKST
jgi:hypothetical protein